jgi:hypothetical protein
MANGESKKQPSAPFAVPKQQEPDLARVRAYWEGLKRAGNEMPFWDDASLSSLPDLADRSMLIDVLTGPSRFRFGTVGSELVDRYGAGVADKFIDEIEPRSPFDYLLSQCFATLEARAPTYHRGAHGRLLLPMWGDGHIGMLLGAVEWR